MTSCATTSFRCSLPLACSTSGRSGTRRAPILAIFVLRRLCLWAVWSDTSRDWCDIQVRFQFTPGGVVLHHPAAFTTCIQEAADSSWWMFPSSESDEWLCAKCKAV